MHLIDRPWIVVMSVWSMFPLPFGWLSHGWLTLHWNILQTIKCECPDTPDKAVDCYSFNILSLSLFNVVYPHEVRIFDRFFELSEDVLKHEAWNETCVFSQKTTHCCESFPCSCYSMGKQWIRYVCKQQWFTTKQELMSQRRFMVIILILFTIASMMRKTVGT